MNLSPALTQNLALRSRRRRRLEGRPRFDTLAMLAPQREDLQSPQGPSLCPANASVAACPPDAVTELRAHGSFTLRQFIRPRTSHAIGGRADLWRSRRLHRSDAIERPRTLTILARCQMARILGQSCPADSLSLPPTLPNSGLKHAIYERSVFSAKKWFRKLARDALGERRIAARTMS